MTEEGLREIQLDGKQLVFFFMAATVVAVVIFLCGVMVGRGAPAGMGLTLDVSEQPSLDPTAPSQRPVPPVGVANGEGPVAVEGKQYYDRLLGGADSPEESLKPASESATERVGAQLEPVRRGVVPKPAQKPAASAAPAPRVPRSVAPRPVTPTSTFPEPKGNGYAVQVAAVPKRDEANTIARRLVGKGYPAFVTTVGSNFRVRVGKYANQREAGTVAQRLEREERLETWVTR